MKTPAGIIQFNWLISLAIAFGTIVLPSEYAAHGQDSGRVIHATTNDTDPALTPGLSEDDIRAGWLSLFDGRSLYGWKSENQCDWHVENGEIRASKGETGLLRTTSQFDDYELRLEFKPAAGTNSGVFLRTSPKPTGPTVDCYELNIAEAADHPFPSGSLVGRIKSTVNATADQWNSFRVICDGPHLKIWLNDQLACEYKDPKSLGRGFIGLQFREHEIAFRNIALKPLNQDSLFDGKSLEGWNIDQKLNSEFSVTPAGEMLIKNGQGQIESNRKFGDFAFSMKCKTNATGLNSGVFFRCIPGELMNGYESQIHNEFIDGDPTKPVDHGTGGIFRRKPARLVVSKDKEWFAKTIIAVGPHIAVWVNGYQVCDWTDQRRPDKNPRRGLRLEPGSIIFQGHDPTTDILIKNIRCKELNARRRN